MDLAAKPNSDYTSMIKSQLSLLDSGSVFDK